MKVKLFITTLLFSALTFAQNFHVGPEIGMILIQLEQKNIGNNYQPSWHTGINFEHDITDWLSVKSGIYYTQKRQSYSSSYTSLFPLFDVIGLRHIE